MGTDRIHSHRDLEVWKRAMDLAVEVYQTTNKFPKEEVYGLSMQARRSAVSIPSNIAEGAARNSSKEFVQYVHASLGSLAELETQLLLARRIGFLTDNKPLDLVDQIRRMLVGLLRSLKRKSITRQSLPVTSSL
jgi:four helix bundle protein